jgi:hypothetical protein
MNKHSIALLALLILIGAGLFALADYQHGRALPAVSAAPAGGGLVINGLMVSSEAAPAAEAAPLAAPIAPTAAEGSGATCP